jgi:two-component system sensor histidine kinase KdpD
MADRKRGRLRIYLGAAPGVGKTYAMLNEGRRRADRGTDVVVAYVEHHDRPRTWEQLAGLEIVPRRSLVHRDRTFEEMDLDAVLTRMPQVALVDELAHTNVSGAANEKRWQDVQVLLDAGIDVISTVNIQHLESLNDVVERITGIVQRETVPDAVVRAAEQVELVDMTPEALRRRMAHGNVYGPEKVEDALTNYFRVGNLTALREMALMWLADKVDEALLSYQDAHDIRRTWETRERVVVAITGAPSGEQLIRRAARLAGRVGGELLGVHVRMGDGLRSAPSAGLERQRTLLRDVGGHYHEVVGDDIAAAVVSFARGEHATQIVLGATDRTRWRELWSGSVVNRVVRASGDMDVHVISRPAASEEPAATGRRESSVRSPLSTRRQVAGWLLVVIAIPLLTAVLVAVRDSFGLPGDLMLYVLLVVLIAAVGGVGPGITAAVACGLLGNWYLTEPYYTLTIDEPENTAALVAFVVVASAVSILVSRTERRAADAEKASAEAEALARVAAGIALDEDPLPALVDRIRTTFGLDGAVLFVQNGSGWEVEQLSGSDVAVRDLADVDLEVSVGDDAMLGLVGAPPGASDQRVLRAFADQLAVGLEQRRLREEADQAQVIAAGDALRTALLRAVSHDLRTPLASIKASVSSLQADDVTWSDADRDDFLATIHEETDRLNQLVGNLLDMGRLQTDVLQLRVRPSSWDEIVTAAVASLPAHDTDRLEIDVPEQLPALSGDPALLERAVANIVANALIHAPDGPVQLDAGATAESVELRVVDHGPGVRAAQRAALFEPFQRLGDAGSTGVGLGLAVAHGFVRAMAGTIVATDTPGGGLTMTISLPRAPADETAVGGEP